jgi:rSAM/selenodomain-associated transferase 1
MIDLPVTVIVIAKEPVPGRVKTRLTPPFTPEQAASLAEAALTDTLDAVAAAPVARRVLALAGTPGPWLPPGFEVIAQRGGGLDERLAAAFDDAALNDGHAGGRRPMLLIGMDTPQVTPELLAEAARPLVSRVADAVFGPAADGGYWLLGLRAPDPSLLLGVPMSRPDTGSAQLARLAAGGLRVAMLPELTDVDDARDAERIASQIPGSRFAAAYDRLARALTVSALPGGKSQTGVTPPGRPRLPGCRRSCSARCTWPGPAASPRSQRSGSNRSQAVGSSAARRRR